MGSAPARYGFHSGAVINLVTKAGSNQIHGDLFEFLRNGDFNGRNASALARDSLKRNQFGGVIGGPARQNNPVFLGGYQGTGRRSDPPVTLKFVPSQTLIKGDFRALASAPCPASPKSL